MKPLKHPTIRRLSGLLLVIAALDADALSARSIIQAGNAGVWKYRDNGREPDGAWRHADFDDATWSSGRAPLGYGDPAMGTEVGWGGSAAHKFITTWFRRACDRPEVKPGERLVIVLCVDDGAVIYLNGREIGRANMPDGPVTADTLALRSLSDSDEGFYLRMPVPVDELHPGRNVLAVEVHQCSAASSDIFFDLALKTMPPDAPVPAVPTTAQAVVDTFHRQHYIGPGVRIPDGYVDGGRAMTLDVEGRYVSHREILVVDRTNDVELARHLAFARSPELQALPPLERALRLAVYIDQETTPPGGQRWVTKTAEELEREFGNKAVLIGEWVDQGHAGVCRHRSLLFKILADEAGLKTALVRGNYDHRDGAHAWNEIVAGDGRRLLVDVMMKHDKQDLPEVTGPVIVQHYLKVDNTLWYEGTAARR